MTTRKSHIHPPRLVATATAEKQGRDTRWRFQ
jgi:hypothetical protein